MTSHGDDMLPVEYKQMGMNIVLHAIGLMCLNSEYNNNNIKR